MDVNEKGRIDFSWLYPCNKKRVHINSLYFLFLQKHSVKPIKSLCLNIHACVMIANCDALFKISQTIKCRCLCCTIINQSMEPKQSHSYCILEKVYSKQKKKDETEYKNVKHFMIPFTDAYFLVAVCTYTHTVPKPGSMSMELLCFLLDKKWWSI